MTRNSAKLSHLLIGVARLPRTRIKICGITNSRDAETAVRLGADALGFMMYEGSSRSVSRDTVRDIVRRLPPFISCVGVFVNPSRDWVTEVCREIPLDILQFHGDEDDEFCGDFKRPFVKAIRVSEDLDLDATIARFPRCRAVLLDSHVEGAYGGTGDVFDWDLVKTAATTPTILAGGLTASNVGEAIESIRPFAVDVSSGVEQDKGIKDPDKLRAFIKAVRSCDEQASRLEV